MAIYLSDIKIDLIIKHYVEEPTEALEIKMRNPPKPLQLKKQEEFRDLTIRAALEELVKLVF